MANTTTATAPLLSNGDTASKMSTALWLEYFFGGPPLFNSPVNKLERKPGLSACFNRSKQFVAKRIFLAEDAFLFHIRPFARRVSPFVSRPIAANTLVKKLVRNTHFHSQFFGREHPSVVRVSDNAIPVFDLLRTSSPTAIFNAVWSAVVNAVDGMLRAWPLAHVRNKICETIFPSFADVYSPSPVSAVIGGRGVMASGFHGFPNAIFFWPFGICGRGVPMFVIHNKRIDTRFNLEGQL